MTFLELAGRRESCRRYMNTPVKRELMNACLEAARLAPSACNAQPWRYIAVDNPAVAAKLRPLLRLPELPINAFVDGVPAFAVAVEKPVDLRQRLGPACLRENYSELDLGLSVAHFCLAAADLGLGTCILGTFREAPIKALLGIPEDFTVRLVVAVGHPAPGEPRPKQRLEQAAVSAYNAFSEEMK